MGKRLARRHSTVSSSNSRDVSTSLDESVVNGMSNLCQIEQENANMNEQEEEDEDVSSPFPNKNKNGNARMVAPLTQQIPRGRRARKRRRNQIASIVEEQPVRPPRLQSLNAVIPDTKRRKVDENKPPLSNAKTTPVRRSNNNK